MPVRSRGAGAPARALETMPRRVLGRIGKQANPIMSPIRVYLKHYPPELPGQQYQRTGNLGAGWDEGLLIQQRGDGVTITATNYTPYSDAVQTLGEQERFFIGRWPTTAGAALDHTGRAVDTVRRAAEAEARKGLS